MTRVAIEEAKARLDELVQAARDGEQVVITDRDGADYTVLPLHAGKRKGLFGALKGKIWMADDFDEPLDDFKEYME